MIKVDLISGFLGAGKTTLIKKLLTGSLKNEKIAIIENEFGKIGIDGSFLKDSGINIKEINSGCICCSLVGDFEKSLKEVIHTYNPERIIIEPSGVGKLSDIINAVNRVEDEDLVINIICTVVDAKKAKIQLNNFGEFFLNQIQYASTVLLAKGNTVSEEKVQEAIELIKNVNDDISLITTPIEELDADLLLSKLEEKKNFKELLKEEKAHHEECHHHEDEDEECCCHHEHHHHHEDEEHDEDCCCHHEHHHHHEGEEHDEDCCHHEHHHHHGHDADEVFISWGFETAKSISKSKLESILNELASNNDLGTILRCKGIIKANDDANWYYFDYVSGDYEIRLGNADVIGKIVVIGSKLDEEKLEKVFSL